MTSGRHRGPFGRLVEHFLVRLTRGGQDAASSEFEFGAGALLGLLAVPGAFQCFLLLDKYSSFLNWYRGRLKQDLYLTSIPDKYQFISLAMAVTGIVTVLKWDKILPDSQDYLNLAPLPVPPRRILLANVLAIAIAVVVFSVDVNGLPALLFPTFVTAASASHTTVAEFTRFAAAHAACVLLSSVFAFCGVFAVLGTLGAVLPRDAFRACSSWVRGILLVAFIMLLLSGFAGSTLARGAIATPDSPLRFLPSLWFLGLYQSLQHAGPSRLAELAPFAVRATWGAGLLMVAAYALSYRRRFVASLEGGPPPSEQRVFAALLAFLDLFAEKTAGFPRACHRFAVRAMLRNEAHRLAIAVALGLGYLLAFQTISDELSAGVHDVRPEVGILQAPLIVAYLLILGLRLAFEVPAGVPPNWIFRTVLDARANETAGIARRVMLSFLTPLVLAPCLALSIWMWGPVIAAIHTLYVLALSVLFIEVLLEGYRKVPLTCPMPGFRDNLLMLCLMLFLGFELFTRFGTAVERWLFHEPARFPLFPAALAGIWWWNRRRIRDARDAGELEEGLTFENIHRPAVERMDL